MTDKASVTVQDLDKIVESIFEAKKEYELIGRQKAEAYNKFVELKAKGVAYLKELDRTNYKAEAGTISIAQKWRVKNPQTDEAKAQLFTWLQDNGIFEKYATVNSNSLNSLHKSEREAAIERGEGMTWKMPGVEEPSLYEDLTTRKS